MDSPDTALSVVPINKTVACTINALVALAGIAFAINTTTNIDATASLPLLLIISAPLLSPTSCLLEPKYRPSNH